MKKVSYSPSSDTYAKRMITHTLGGAALGGYASHRAAKLDPKDTKKRFGGHASRVLSGAAGGALAGATLGEVHGMVTPIFDKNMVSAAKEQIKAKGHNFRDIHQAVGTAAGAALGGGYGYLGARKANKKSKKKVLDPRAAAAIGAGVGASFGHTGGTYARWGHMNKLLKGPAKANIPSWLKGVKTKAEAKSAYRAEARKHHPDLGGNAEKFKKIQSDWEGFEKQHFDKLSHVLQGFFSELFTIEV